MRPGLYGTLTTLPYFDKTRNIKYYGSGSYTGFSLLNHPKSRVTLLPTLDQYKQQLAVEFTPKRLN